jgi:preprotein translocase subunit SecB
MVKEEHVKAEPAEEKAAQTSSDYNEFVEGLSLVRMRLTEMKAESAISEPPEEGVKIAVQEDAEVQWEEGSNECEFTYSILLEIQPLENEDEALASIECTYVLDFESETIPEKEDLDIFSKHNLWSIVWPYFREIVYSTLAKMELPPLLLPIRTYFQHQ